MIIHKNNNLSVSYNDEFLSYLKDKMGISPYMLLVNAVLVHNEQLIDMAEHKLHEYFKLKGKAKRNYNQKKMEYLREFCEKCLNIDYIRNVFHYKIDLSMFDSGNRIRGINSKREGAIAKLEELSTQIEIKNEKSEKLFDLIANSLLGIISILSFIQLQQVVFTFGTEAMHKFPNFPLSWWLPFLLITPILLIFLVIYFIKKKKTISK